MHQLIKFHILLMLHFVKFHIKKHETNFYIHFMHCKNSDQLHMYKRKKLFFFFSYVIGEIK